MSPTSPAAAGRLAALKKLAATYCPTLPPAVRPSSLSNRKWMPPYIRLSADSCAASEKLVNERAGTAEFSLGNVNAIWLVPKKLLSTVAAAPLKLECPEIYVGNGGVTISGVQFATAV